MFKKLLEERNIENVTVESAGLAAFLNDPASDNAVEAMKEKGVDLSGHRSQRINRQLLGEASLIVALSKSGYDILREYAPDKTVLLGEGITDPFGGDIDIYRKCRDEIAEELPKIADMLDKIEDLPENEDGIE